MIKTLFSGLLTILVLFGALTQPEVALGQEEDPYSYEITQPEFDEYYAAITNCETPSLECLVRYTTRFVAIEWVNDITGTEKIGTATGPSSLGPDGQPIADSGRSSGAIYGLFYGMGMMYANPPANTQTYVADVVNSAGFAPPAYAQGLGFASLDPILNLWKTFRNIAYFFFILFFIVIGIMIMFRYKLGGQAAITAQQAIPSVIVSLILVTFSYAIAGFMIDLMYVVMFMIVGIFSGTLMSSSMISGNANQILNMNIFDVGLTLFSGIFSGDSWWGDNVINTILDYVVDRASGTGAAIVNIIGGLTLTIIVSIAVLIGVIRLFFELLKSYFSIIISVVSAPVLLMIGAVPGTNVFWPWLRNIIGNLAAFPTVLLAIILFIEFTTAPGGGPVTGGFMPPFLIGSGTAGMIGPLLGLATLLALPEIVKKVKESLGATEGWFATLGAAAFERFNDGVRKTPITAGLAGATVGGAAGVVAAARNRERSFGAYRDSLLTGAAGGYRRASRPVQWGVKQYEQLREGRTFDPNSWENALLRLEEASRHLPDRRDK